jgi:alpha-L-fucosidase
MRQSDGETGASPALVAESVRMGASQRSRRDFLKASAVLAVASATPTLARGGVAQRRITGGPFQPTWESLTAGYKCPEWFRDAKFGIWAHWSAQCVPEQGDWYARRMYLQGDSAYEHHLRTYGHPSAFGFMEIDRLWKAERWDPARLIDVYKRAGAKYFFALANHHDNFDAYSSRHHDWNSVNVGPKRDIVGEWAKAARAAGLRFGVSNHSAHAWHWFQPSYGYDPEGARAGVRYDAFKLTKADGKGTWWEGLDPQDLYTGRNLVMPDGIHSVSEANAWHRQHDQQWIEDPPAQNPAFVDKWFLRCRDLIDSYQPDVLYFDNTELPLGHAGLDIAAHYYNSALARRGSLDVVLTAKKMTAARRGALVEDIERGVATAIREAPWQTDTCIGSWHYERRLFDEHRYKTTPQVVHMLIDIVSKNGNLMLSVPLRGDGTFDQDEEQFLEGLASWMAVNGEGIFATRPWTRFGEGPAATEAPESGQFGGARDVRRTPYTSKDIRFTRKGDVLYAYVLAWPEDRTVTIGSLGTQAAVRGQVERVDLLGAGPLPFTADIHGLDVQFPQTKTGDHAFALAIRGLKLD